MTGPLGYGSRAVPARRASRCRTPSSSRTRPVLPRRWRSVQVVQQLDPNLDPRSFRLGDLQLGDIQVHLPSTRGSFQGDFDFTQTKGFILRVSAGIDLNTDTLSYLLQAIDPATGEVVQDPPKGLLQAEQRPGSRPGVHHLHHPAPGGPGHGDPDQRPGPGAVQHGRAAGHAHHHPDDRRRGPRHDADRQPGLPPAARTTRSSGTRWTTPAARGVKDVTVYVAEDGGDYQIWLNQTDGHPGDLQRPGRPHLPVPGAGHRQCRQPRAAAGGLSVARR